MTRAKNFIIPSASISDSDDRVSRRSFLAAGSVAAAACLLPSASVAQSANTSGAKFRRVRTQFIAALGDPDATSGSNANFWGLWRQDPGPRGVRLNRFDRLVAAGGVAPAKWQFDAEDWWLEENGLIMEQPEFPLPTGQYLVTGNREVTTVLTIHPPDGDGGRRWELANGASIYDVTHLRCRSARYTSASNGGACSPSKAQVRDFPVTPGAEMPPVEGCDKQDFAVLFVIGIAES
jgi:hypothetical protein